MFVATSRIACKSHKPLVDLANILIFRCPTCELIVAFLVNTDINTETRFQKVWFVNTVLFKKVLFIIRRVARIWKRGGGYFESVRSVQTTLTRIVSALESVSHGLHEN